MRGFKKKVNAVINRVGVDAPTAAGEYGAAGLGTVRTPDGAAAVGASTPTRLITAFTFFLNPRTWPPYYGVFKSFCYDKKFSAT